MYVTGAYPRISGRLPYPILEDIKTYLVLHLLLTSLSLFTVSLKTIRHILHFLSMKQ